MARRERLTLLFVGCLVALETAYGWSGPPAGGSPALVQIEGEAFTADTLQEMATQLPPPLRKTEQGRRKAMDWIIDWKLLLAESLRSDVERTPEVQARIAAARDRIVVAEYVNRLLRERVVLTEAELEAHYAEHRDEFKASEAIRLSQILVRSAHEAQEILRDLEQGADFDRLASERSLDPSRRNGGQMGWVERQLMDPDLAAAAFALTASETSGIVHTKLGYHVIRVDETRPSEYAAYAAVRSRIRENLHRQRARDVMQELAKELRGKARIVIDETALEALQVQPGEAPPVP